MTFSRYLVKEVFFDEKIPSKILYNGIYKINYK